MGGLRPGQAVRVAPRTVRTHHRTPGYVKGKVGRVQALAGRFPDPESRAYGGAGLPERPLYRVQFDMGEVWGDRYQGPPGDRLIVDIFAHWLEPVGDPACVGGGP